MPDVDDTALRDSHKKALDEKKQLEESLNRALGGRKLEDVAALLEQQAKAQEELARRKGDIDSIVEKRLKTAREQ